jgi:hypothetical protein
LECAGGGSAREQLAWGAVDGALASIKKAASSRRTPKPRANPNELRPHRSMSKTILKGFIVNRKAITSSLSLLLILVVLSAVAAQTRKSVTPPQSAITGYLPPSDAIAIIDVKRMLSETVPGIFGGDVAKLAQANAEVDKFKTRTGVDLRSVDRLAIGIHYMYPTAKTTKLEVVAIGHGSFDAKAVTASARAAANGKSREEKYHGVTITIIDVNDDLKMLGLWTMHVNDLAICVLDQNSLGLGTLANVRAAIDAGQAGRAPADLIGLATRDQNSVIGFAANVTPELLAQLDVGNDTIAKDVSAIKQAYGSVGSTQTDVTMTLVARTNSVEAAKNLGDTVEGLRQLGGIFITRMTEPRKSLAESALNNLKITARGDDLEIRTQVTAASLAALVK